MVSSLPDPARKQRGYVMKSSILAAGLICVAGITSADDKPVLTVMTYDSFVSDWGPGPAVEAAFEARCGCDLKFVGAGDGAALLARLKLEGASTRADVVLGLDTALTAAAAETGLFAPHGIDAEFDLPIDWNDPLFLPYDFTPRMKKSGSGFRSVSAPWLSCVRQSAEPAPRRAAASFMGPDVAQHS